MFKSRDIETANNVMEKVVKTCKNVPNVKVEVKLKSLCNSARECTLKQHKDVPIAKDKVK